MHFLVYLIFLGISDSYLFIKPFCLLIFPGFFKIYSVRRLLKHFVFLRFFLETFEIKKKSYVKDVVSMSLLLALSIFHALYLCFHRQVCKDNCQGIQERGTECGECGEREESSLGFQETSQKIPGNVIILTFRGMFQRIPGNIEQHSGECSRRFWGMFQRISENVEEDSGGCSRGFRGIFHKIAGNFRKDSGECSKRFGRIFKKIPENAAEEPGECSRRFRGMMNKILRNVCKDSRKYSKRLNTL